MLALFAHRGATRCTRYDLPLLQAFNFVVDDVLEGGVNGSLNLDGHGKTQSFRLLSLTVRVPRALAPNMSAALAEGFDLRALPPASTTTRFRSTARCASTSRSSACPTAAIPDALRRLDPSTATRALLAPTSRSNSRRNTATSPLFEHHTTSLVFNDPPLHTRVRRADQGRADAARDRRDGAGARSPWSTGCSTAWPRRAAADLIEDFAAAIPIEIIGNLLGVPSRARAAARLVAGDPRRARAGRDAGARRAAIAPSANSSPISRPGRRRRAAPGDPEHDVLTRLIQGEEGGERLTEPSCCTTASSCSMPGTRPPPT